MVNAQEWLDEKYPVNRRNEITELDVSKGKVKKWNGHERTLKGDLKLAGFTNLRILTCSEHELTNLDVSECKNLRELDCNSNELNSLNISGCSKLKKINCVGNNYLGEIEIEGCLEIAEIGTEFIRDTEKSRLIRNSLKSSGPLINYAEDNDIRNILIIGITGNGKSALANTLSNTTDDNKFRESNSSTSVTKNSQESDIFSWQGKNYRVIDNIGFGDTNNIAEEDILFKIGEGIHAAKDGINQILFVFKGRFSPEHVMAFNLFKDFIAETGITRFTTLIRTNFSDFKSQEKCEEDQKVLLRQTSELSEIINSCNGIIHVDNPSIFVNEKRARINKKKREESRKKVLDHLAENCPQIYKLKEWESIYARVEKYKRKKAEIEQSDSVAKKEKLEKEWNKVNKEIKVSLGAEFPGFGKYNAAVEYNTQKAK